MNHEAEPCLFFYMGESLDLSHPESNVNMKIRKVIEIERERKKERKIY